MTTATAERTEQSADTNTNGTTPQGFDVSGLFDDVDSAQQHADEKAGSVEEDPTDETTATTTEQSQGQTDEDAEAEQPQDATSSEDGGAGSEPAATEEGEEENSPPQRRLTETENQIILIQNAELACIESESEWTELKEQTSAAKKRHDANVDRLRRYVRALKFDADRPLLGIAEGADDAAEEVDEQPAEESSVEKETTAAETDATTDDSTPTPETESAELETTSEPADSLPPGHMRIRLLEEIQADGITYEEGSQQLARIDKDGDVWLVADSDDRDDDLFLEPKDYEEIDATDSSSDSPSTPGPAVDPLDTELGSIPNLASGTVGKLYDAEIRTVRDYITYTKEQPLTSIPGVGKKKAADAAAVMTPWLSANVNED